jgi:hypothetical protein
MIEPFDLYDEFWGLIDILNREKIPYAVCGGIAVAIYGYVRATQDIDILVLKDDVERISTAIREQDFIFDAGRIPFNVGGPEQREIHRISKIVDDEVLTLDLLLVDDVYQSIWDNREAAEWQGQMINVVPLDGLLEMKRIAGRNKDLLDIDELTEGRRGE